MFLHSTHTDTANTCTFTVHTKPILTHWAFRTTVARPRSLSASTASLATPKLAPTTGTSERAGVRSGPGPRHRHRQGRAKGWEKKRYLYNRVSVNGKFSVKNKNHFQSRMKTSQDLKWLHWIYLIGCQGVKLFITKDFFTFCHILSFCVLSHFGLCKILSFRFKLDGVGPVDNSPSTDKLHHFVWKKKCDMWHVTRDKWHMTCDRFGGGWTFSQNFSSLALTNCDLWYYEDLEEKDDSLN